MKVGQLAFALCLHWLLVACGEPSPLPDMEPGESGRVVRVIDGDALALNTGQSVRLIGIEAPALRPRGREPDSFAVESQRILEDMALGREVQLYYSGMTRDRYDRALAHVVTTDGAGPKLWLNMELVARGAARVRFYPDTAIREADFLTAERESRAAERGLWKTVSYRIADASRINKDVRGFMLLEATLSGAVGRQTEPSRDIACVRELKNATLRVEVRKEARDFCEAADGSAYRLRGWLSNGRLDLTVATHAERLPD